MPGDLIRHLEDRGMKRILYAGGDLLTTDEVADALMEYASVLAIIGSADLVDVPALDRGGEQRTARLLVGPASQILSIDTDDEDRDLGAADALGVLRGRARDRLPTAVDVVTVGEADDAESDAETAEH
jgi:hypothetical protein